MTTAFIPEITDYLSLVYHSEMGLVHFIKRPSATLSLVVDGKAKSIDLGTGRFASDVMFFKSQQVDFYVIQLGCGTLLQFTWSVIEYLDQGRHCVPLELATIINQVPTRVSLDSLPSFEF